MSDTDLRKPRVVSEFGAIVLCTLVLYPLALGLQRVRMPEAPSIEVIRWTLAATISAGVIIIITRAVIWKMLDKPNIFGKNIASQLCAVPILLFFAGLGGIIASTTITGVQAIVGDGRVGISLGCMLLFSVPCYFNGITVIAFFLQGDRKSMRRFWRLAFKAPPEQGSGLRVSLETPRSGDR